MLNMGPNSFQSKQIAEASVTNLAGPRAVVSRTGVTF